MKDHILLKGVAGTLSLGLDNLVDLGSLFLDVTWIVACNDFVDLRFHLLIGTSGSPRMEQNKIRTCLQ